MTTVATGPSVIISVPAVGDVEVYPVYVDGEIVRSFTNPNQQERYAQVLAAKNNTVVQSAGAV